MKRWLYAIFLATITIPISASSAEERASASSGTLIGCVFGMRDDDPTKRTGLAIFLPETGTGRHALSPDQVFDPNHLLKEGGFDAITIENGVSELSGKNGMTLMFMGGEIYEGSLNGNTLPDSLGWCVVPPFDYDDGKSAFAFFASTLDDLRRR